MPQPIADLPPAALRGCGLPAAIAGCYGKIPARGDFVRLGLPRDFIDPWDGWLAPVLAASRAALGEGWLGAWLEAPIWHFALAPGLCGAEAAIGVWMPSVDRVGRHFPLTVAAIVPGAGAAELIRDGGGFLAVAEDAGLAAVTEDLSPEALLARLREAIAQPPAAAPVAPELWLPAGALWWTAGAPRVPAATLATAALPTEDVFAAMLDAQSGARS